MKSPDWDEIPPGIYRTVQRDMAGFTTVTYTLVKTLGTYPYDDTMRPEGPHGRNTSLGTDPPTS